VIRQRHANESCHRGAPTLCKTRWCHSGTRRFRRSGIGRRDRARDRQRAPARESRRVIDAGPVRQDQLASALRLQVHARTLQPQSARYSGILRNISVRDSPRPQGMLSPCRLDSFDGAVPSHGRRFGWPSRKTTRRPAQRGKGRTPGRLIVGTTDPSGRASQSPGHARPPPGLW